MPTLTPKAAWQALLGDLQVQLDTATFDTWLKGTEVLAYEDGEFVIRVAHAYAKDWIEKHLAATITRLLSEVFGRTVQVNYVVYLRNTQRVNTGPGTLFAGLNGDADKEPAPGQTSHDDTPGNDPAHSDGPADTLPAQAALPAASTPVTSAPGALAPARKPGPASPSAHPSPATTKPAPKPSQPNEQAESDDSLDNTAWDPRFTDVRRTTSTTQAVPDPVEFNPVFTFSAFVTGPNNHFAHAAAQAVAKPQPEKGFNPLVIYGGTGLGKTHLLQAIGSARQDAGQRVMYITAEAFTNEVVEAIRERKTADLRERYRTVDVLLLDDMQFMAGKAKTEEEFYHTFNSIFSRGGQVVIACNQHPRELAKLDDRLRSRLMGGLLVDIRPPEFATRRAILLAKSRAQGQQLPGEVANALAQHETANVRALEGLLTQVLARTTLTGEPLTLALAQQALHQNGNGPHRTRRAITIEHILEATAAYLQLPLDDLLSKRRTKDVSHARHIAMYLAREETDASYPQIGEAIGGRNHSTVMYGYRKIAAQLKTDHDLRRQVSAIRHQLRLLPGS